MLLMYIHMYFIHCAILIHILFSFVMCFIFLNYMDLLSEMNNQSINQHKELRIVSTSVTNWGGGVSGANITQQ